MASGSVSEFRSVLTATCANLPRTPHVRSAFADSPVYPSMGYVLDRVLDRGHVDPNVQPDTAENECHVDGFSTSACEMLFAWSAGYKHSFRKKGRWTKNLFIHELLDLHNVDKFGKCSLASVANSTENTSWPTSPI